jgi:hypothetical protein
MMQECTRSASMAAAIVKNRRAKSAKSLPKMVSIGRRHHPRMAIP